MSRTCKPCVRGITPQKTMWEYPASWPSSTHSIVNAITTGFGHIFRRYAFIYTSLSARKILRGRIHEKGFDSLVFLSIYQCAEKLPNIHRVHAEQRHPYHSGRQKRQGIDGSSLVKTSLKTSLARWLWRTKRWEKTNLYLYILGNRSALALPCCAWKKKKRRDVKESQRFKLYWCENFPQIKSTTIRAATRGTFLRARSISQYWFHVEEYSFTVRSTKHIFMWCTPSNCCNGVRVSNHRHP